MTGTWYVSQVRADGATAAESYYRLEPQGFSPYEDACDGEATAEEIPLSARRPGTGSENSDDMTGTWHVS